MDLREELINFLIWWLTSGLDEEEVGAAEAADLYLNRQVPPKK